MILLAWSKLVSVELTYLSASKLAMTSGFMIFLPGIVASLYVVSDMPDLSIW